MPAIIIVVEGGCVVEVKNLPDAWYYEIDDRDADDRDADDEDTFANSCDDENCRCRAEYDYPDNIADGCPYATDNKKERASANLE